MKKKRTAVIAALSIGIAACLQGYGSAGLAVMAGETESISGDMEESVLPEGEKSAVPDAVLSEDENAAPPEASPTEAEEKEDTPSRLQMPQKLSIVVDPWEMDGRGQVYSEEYVIKNTGETAGTLTLSGLKCTPRKNSGVKVRENKRGLRDGKEKNLYMEIAFGEEDTVVLTREGAEYQTGLEPGEELTLCFKGELNENASKSWKDGDVTVTVVYDWKPAEDVADEEEEPQKNAPKDKKGDKEGEEDKESKDNDESGEKDVSPVSPDESGASPSEEAEPEHIKLQSSVERDIVIDHWTADGKGRSVSREYILENTGDMEGMLYISGLPQDAEEPCGITLQADGRDVRELSGDGTAYETRLSPGEKISLRFVGEADTEGTGGKSEAEVTVAFSWETEENQEDS